MLGLPVHLRPLQIVTVRTLLIRQKYHGEVSYREKILE
jgi:hypothetical protein